MPLDRVPPQRDGDDPPGPGVPVRADAGHGALTGADALGVPVGADALDGLVHVLITAGDETSAYRVFDSLVDRFPGVEPPSAPAALPGLVVLSVLAPTREAERRP